MTMPGINSLADDLGVPESWLHRLIDFESRFNPQAKNPRSSARGLIQFTNDTARGLGFADSAEIVAAYPGVEEQLAGPVKKYLSRFKPFPTEQSLFMAVFYPAARYWPANKAFPDNVQAVNPGIFTPADYMRKVYFRAGLNYIPSIALFIIGIIGIYLLRKGG